MVSAHNLKLRRVDKKWTQKELAEKAGVGLGSVIRIESDDFGPEAAMHSTVQKITDALNYRLDD